jgi:hypothetical protein
MFPTERLMGLTVPPEPLKTNVPVDSDLVKFPLMVRAVPPRPLCPTIDQLPVVLCVQFVTALEPPSTKRVATDDEVMILSAAPGVPLGLQAVVVLQFPEENQA